MTKLYTVIVAVISSVSKLNGCIPYKGILDVVYIIPCLILSIRVCIMSVNCHMILLLATMNSKYFLLFMYISGINFASSKAQNCPFRVLGELESDS